MRRWISSTVQEPKYCLGQIVVFQLQSDNIRQGEIVSAHYEGTWSYRVSYYEKISVGVGESQILAALGEKKDD